MKPHALRWSAAATATVAALALTLSMLPAAGSQSLISPSVSPIGVGAAGNTSTVWFHEPSSGRVTACQTVSSPGGGLSAIQCVAAKLQ